MTGDLMLFFGGKKGENKNGNLFMGTKVAEYILANRLSGN